MNTAQLIERLRDAPQPVRPLTTPWIRAVGWLALAVPYIALVVFVVSPRNDLSVKLTEWRFVVEQIAVLSAGVTAAIAAFATTIPGLDRRFLLLPLLPLAVWLGSLVQGCIDTLFQKGLVGLTLQPDWFCFPGIVLVGAVPAITMACMLRRGAPLTPRITTALGGLAAAGLGNFGLRLFHPQDASVMMLVWQVGAVIALSALACCAGRCLLDWRWIVGSTRWLG